MFGSSTNNRTYFRIANGSVVLSKDVEYKDSLEKFRQYATKIVERTNKVGRTVVEAFFGSFTGKLKSIDLTTFQYEGNDLENWNVLFEGLDGNEYVWTVPSDSYLFQSFINCLCSVPENENFDKVEIAAYQTKPNAKGVSGTGIAVKVNDKKTAWKYGKDSEVQIPKSVPYLDQNGKPLVIKGFTQLNHTPRTDFVANLVKGIQARLVTDNAYTEFDGQEPSEDDETPF